MRATLKTTMVIWAPFSNIIIITKWKNNNNNNNNDNNNNNNKNLFYTAALWAEYEVFRPTGPRQYWIALRFPIWKRLVPDYSPFLVQNDLLIREKQWKSI